MLCVALASFLAYGSFERHHTDEQELLSRPMSTAEQHQRAMHHLARLHKVCSQPHTWTRAHCSNAA